MERVLQTTPGGAWGLGVSPADWAGGLWGSLAEGPDSSVTSLLAPAPPGTCEVEITQRFGHVVGEEEGETELFGVAHLPQRS